MSTMRVSITDREALRALSWKAVKAYLDASGSWQRADEIPQKGVIYQHTGTDGRLWEIAVLLRDDLADYVSRMADAVTILARVEDRSELDVYDELRALGAHSDQDTEQPPRSTNGHAPIVDEAVRAVHIRIRKWLAEEGWRVEDVPVPPENFNVVALQSDGRAVNIFQGNDHLDHVTLSLRGLHDPGIRQVISRLPESDLRDVLWTIYRDVSVMGVECYGLDTPVNEMVLRTSLYFDGLSKDVLMQRIHLVNRAYRLAIRALVHALEARSHTDENILSPDELTKIRHLPPAAGEGPLTVAS